tara:strand:- start:9912 stop:10118 length:207 start_codon:yes stop_codon:yes gene_type:complete
MGWRGKLTGSNISIKVDGLAELEVHVDALETKVDDMITLVSALSKEIAELKKPKKAAPKKAVKKKAVK